MVSVVIVDDHAMFRTGVKAEIDAAAGLKTLKATDRAGSGSKR